MSHGRLHCTKRDQSFLGVFGLMCALRVAETSIPQQGEVGTSCEARRRRALRRALGDALRRALGDALRCALGNALRRALG